MVDGVYVECLSEISKSQILNENIFLMEWENEAVYSGRTWSHVKEVSCEGFMLRTVDIYCFRSGQSLETLN